MISFDSSIYRKEAVRQACSDYRELADIRIIEEPGSFLCDIRNPQADPDLISDEFCNYVLNLTIMMGGASN